MLLFLFCKKEKKKGQQAEGRADPCLQKQAEATSQMQSALWSLNFLQYCHKTLTYLHYLSPQVQPCTGRRVLELVSLTSRG